ncbi:MAG: hypothetical protein K6G62_02950 [Eubacterium sp.]|nr:hypothetical protein [Eubacterium sp.]
MAVTYQGTKYTNYTIVEPELASGGEGKIYDIKENPNLVAKIFKTEFRDAERDKKLRQMIKEDFSQEQLSMIAWPLDVLTDQFGFVGYVMPKLQNVRPLPDIYKGGFEGGFDLRYRVVASINLCKALKMVHDSGQVCGDLNPHNISVNIDKVEKDNRCQVILVDTDSYHFRSQSQIYRCGVGQDEYIAPELHAALDKGYDLMTVPFPSYTKDTDYFALAVHIFQLLMNGYHPFQCVKDKNSQVAVTSIPQPIENIKKGFFPYYHKKEGLTTPRYAPEFSFLPEKIQQLFVQTFVDGYNNPFARVKEDEWIEVLTETKFVAKKCQVGGEIVPHYYFAGRKYKDCPICALMRPVQNKKPENFVTQEEKVAAAAKEEKKEKKSFFSKLGSGIRK